MSSAPNPEALRSAFAAERFTFEETSIQFTLAEAGRLAVGNGRIAAGDAHAEPAPLPFTQCVPDGEYPVTLALACFNNGEQGLAYARVQLRDAPATSWYPALTAEQDARTLRADDFFGFVVDSEAACFASAGNAVSFSSGVRNGRYASYFGYDSAGRVTALVTDFALVPGVRTAPIARKSWWNRLLSFWK